MFLGLLWLQLRTNRTVQQLIRGRSGRVLDSLQRRHPTLQSKEVKPRSSNRERKSRMTRRTTLHRQRRPRGTTVSGRLPTGPLTAGIGTAGVILPGGGVLGGEAKTGLTVLTHGVPHEIRGAPVATEVPRTRSMKSARKEAEMVITARMMGRVDTRTSRLPQRPGPERAQPRAPEIERRRPRLPDPALPVLQLDMETKAADLVLQRGIPARHRSQGPASAWLSQPSVQKGAAKPWASVQEATCDRWMPGARSLGPRPIRGPSCSINHSGDAPGWKPRNSPSRTSAPTTASPS